MKIEYCVVLTAAELTVMHSILEAVVSSEGTDSSRLKMFFEYQTLAKKVAEQFDLVKVDAQSQTTYDD